MNEPLTAYGELCNVPWTLGGNPAWTVVTDQGHALYWEWRPEENGQGAEDFLIFVRTVFPNGGAFCKAQSNNAIIWTPVDDDIHAVGIRKLRHSASWIVAVLETPEEYPGASACPDRSLSAKACRFIAEEFLRGTNPLDLYNCDPSICKENSSWWRYVEKLEKVVNWKYPEANIFRKANGDSSEKNHRGKRWDRNSDKKYSRERSRSGSRRVRRIVSRSRSPADRAIMKRKPAQSDSIIKHVRPVHTQPMQKEVTKRSGLRCDRCNVDFEQSFELMRHYNTEMHQASLAKEFPF